VRANTPFQYETGIQSVLNNYGYTTGQKKVFKEGVSSKPEALLINSIEARLQLVEGRKINDQWYTRDFGASYVILNKDRNDNDVDMLIYARKSWRSIPTPENLELADVITVLYQGRLTSNFKVIEKRVVASDDTFVPTATDRRNIILIVNDPKENLNYIFTLEFTNII
jgi:hypothetical protein